MPISIPDAYLETYGRDKKHFEHVLDFLLVPSLSDAGIDSIKPISAGSELIHAEIIEQLEKSDLVLCDMSCLNPNVFFELGIRTALNKPVCMVRDDLAPAVPFDLAAINCHTYLSDLSPWKVADEKPKLTKHIRETLEKCKGVNALWKHFGARRPAEPLEFRQPLAENPYMQGLMKQMEEIKSDLARAEEQPNMKKMEQRLRDLERQ
jgi:hypothetical protein